MDDFYEASRELIRLSSARVVRTAEELASEWEEILNEKSFGEVRRPQARAYVENLGGAALRNWEIINESMIQE